MSGPIVGKRRLRAELRKLRRDRDLTQDQVAADMEWSLSKLIRIENGTVAISVSDLRSLLSYYAVHDPKRMEELLNLARAAKRRMWWDEYRTDVPAQLLTFIGFESESTQIGSFQPILFPGLLQTEHYARAVTALGARDFDVAELERLVELRMRRQTELFDREDPPHIVAVLDESVLRRQPDSTAETMREQLAHVIEFAQRPYASIHVIPYTAGAHPGWDGNFTIFEFGDDDQVLYSQNNPTALVLLWEEQETVDKFVAILADLAKRALNPDESLEFIKRVAAELSQD